MAFAGGLNVKAAVGKIERCGFHSKSGLLKLPLSSGCSTSESRLRQIS